MKKKAIIGAFILSVAIVGILLNDIYQDQRHKIIIDGRVSVYSDWTKYPTVERPIFSISNTDSLRVKRIKYGKDYMAIKIKTDKEQTGWVFSGLQFISNSNDYRKKY